MVLDSQPAQMSPNPSNLLKKFSKFLPGRLRAFQNLKNLQNPPPAGSISAGRPIPADPENRRLQKIR